MPLYHVDVGSQWGHGFVAVERPAPGSGAGAGASSQWGHGFVAVESGQPAGTCSPSQVAMGPRLCSRGEEVPTITTTRRGLVAMGPRLCSRGEIDHAGQPHHSDRLSQWGHGFVAVESTAAPAAPAPASRRNGATAL